MQARDIVVLKTTGEKVYLIAETDRRTWTVRRPHIADNGSIQHEVEEFFESELETIPEFAERTVNEMILKAQKQKQLLRTELKITEDVENEANVASHKDEPDPVN